MWDTPGTTSEKVVVMTRRLPCHVGFIWKLSGVGHTIWDSKGSFTMKPKPFSVHTYIHIYIWK